MNHIDDLVWESDCACTLLKDTQKWQKEQLKFVGIKINLAG
jgi:hypothetical protein